MGKLHRVPLYIKHDELILSMRQAWADNNKKCQKMFKNVRIL